MYIIELTFPNQPQIIPNPAKPSQARAKPKSKKKAWISLGSLVRIERFQGVALAPRPFFLSWLTRPMKDRMAMFKVRATGWGVLRPRGSRVVDRCSHYGQGSTGFDFSEPIVSKNRRARIRYGREPADMAH